MASLFAFHCLTASAVIRTVQKFFVTRQPLFFVYKSRRLVRLDGYRLLVHLTTCVAA
jgi:hypothetical protein